MTLTYFSTGITQHQQKNTTVGEDVGTSLYNHGDGRIVVSLFSKNPLG